MGMQTLAEPRVKRPPIAGRIAPFPAVARKLLDLVSRDDSTMTRVADLVRSDAAFSAEVLRLANSALFGQRYEVVNIFHAISILGLNRLQAMVLTIALRDMLSVARHEPILRACWRHNLGAALVAEAVAGWTGVDRPDGYTAGLLHDIGRLALIGAAPNQYHAVTARFTRGGVSLEEAEQQVFGFHQGDLGDWLAIDWGLPPRLCEVVFLHRSAPAAGWNLCSVARWGCFVSHRLGFTVAGQAPKWDADAILGPLPATLQPKVGPELPEWRESIPFKVTSFEREFLSR